jgi:hypothetical protein
MRHKVIAFAFAVACCIVVSVASQAAGQFGRQWGPRATLATAESFSGDWHFCRLAYQGRAWATDYPDADYNFSTRVSELTRAPVSRDVAGEVRPLIVRPSDDTLFQCPFVMLWQAESLYFSEADARRLKEYLLKGGFIWADDFWGSYGWRNFSDQMARVLPPSQYPFVDVPPDHSVFRTLYDVVKVPQIPGISFWWGSRGGTSEQGADSAEVHVRAILDQRGRIVVLATHNTDIADGWEREGVDPRYFYEFSRDSYAVGINVLLYAMTH